MKTCQPCLLFYPDLEPSDKCPKCEVEELVPVSIYVGDNNSTFRLATDCEPKYEYHYMVSKELVERYARVMQEYRMLMSELEATRDHKEREPLGE